MQRYEEKFNSIDTAMITEISERTSGQIEEKLQGLWKQATKREEEKSATIWLKQDEWFQNYEASYGDKSILKLKPKYLTKDKEQGKEEKSPLIYEKRNASKNRSQPKKTESYATAVTGYRGKEQNTKSVKYSKQTNAKRNTSKPVELLQSRDRSPSYPENDIWDNEEWTQIRGQRNRKTRGRGRNTGNRETEDRISRPGHIQFFFRKRLEQTTAKPRCSSELNKTTNRIDPKVINLSSTKLDNSQIDLLIKGFKFTPTPTPNTTILKSDIQQFSRRLRLREYFGNGKFDDGSLVRNKSTFTPKTGRDEYLDSFIDTISINYHNTKQNLSRREKKSLEELKNNPSIILKEADKGGGIVIMDKTFYREKVLEQLNDNEYYTKLRKNNDKSTIRKIKRLVKEYSESFTANEIAYLCDFTPKEANFYGLPKIHKSNTIQTAVKHQNKKYIESPNPSDLKLRPIVAGPESPTQRMSHFLDLILKKLCPLIPSYVRDDIDFLRTIASNSEDEIKIIKAENRAIRKKKAKSKSEGEQQQITSTANHSFNSQQPFRGGQPSWYGGFPYAQDQYAGKSQRGPCFNCGSYKHWRVNCPFQNNK
ncbi:unnamed protein product [Mytilus edulis]|uniref:CCHC-type domain-containing protein n=1 Tax=Mytilus edulis TaxID=6550 RepID=A0A8S3SCE3_MYTED|nr:unnamed protein product [Mytilus edulis]